MHLSLFCVAKGTSSSDTHKLFIFLVNSEQDVLDVCQGAVILKQFGPGWNRASPEGCMWVNVGDCTKTKLRLIIAAG